MTAPQPARGELWLVNLDPARGHEQAGTVSPPEGGLTLPSFVKCEDVRSVSVDRLVRRLGSVEATTLALVEDRLRILMGL